MTGREAQARRDAMADAETFRLNVKVSDRKRMKDLRIMDRLAGSLRAFIHTGNVEANANEATGAARAAFRAVPALRGDR